MALYKIIIFKKMKYSVDHEVSTSNGKVTRSNAVISKLSDRGSVVDVFVVEFEKIPDLIKKLQKIVSNSEKQ